MSRPVASFTELRRRIWTLEPERRNAYLALLNEILEKPAGQQQGALAKLSARVLRAQSLDARPVMQR